MTPTVPDKERQRNTSYKGYVHMISTVEVEEAGMTSRTICTILPHKLLAVAPPHRAEQ